ncbi:unnamed protein product [Rotaria sp. Silwood2]|nr:unnamed protein product [Rotaria sp. Silwood2]
MPTRKLSRNGPEVSAVGFGAMGLSAFYGSVASDEERFKVLDRVIELGIIYIDSSDIYGDSEDLIGKYFKKYPHQRQKVLIATKFGLAPSSDKSRSVRGDREFIRQSCANSLQRLGIDSIDLYYAHRIDKTTPIEETMAALKELVNEGKIKYVGLCECSSNTIRRAHAVYPLSAVQIEYSPFSLEIEHEDIAVLKTCRELGITIFCYSPLGRGILTGQIKSPDDFDDGDFRKRCPRFSKENFPKNLQLVETLSVLAKKKGCTTGQITLAWILAQGNDFIPIPGTTKIKNLEENAAAALINLSNEEEREIRNACEKADVAGERYQEALSG